MMRVADIREWKMTGRDKNTGIVKGREKQEQNGSERMFIEFLPIS